jgi:hypothetical protein
MWSSALLFYFHTFIFSGSWINYFSLFNFFSSKERLKSVGVRLVYVLFFRGVVYVLAETDVCYFHYEATYFRLGWVIFISLFFLKKNFPSPICIFSLLVMHPANTGTKMGCLLVFSLDNICFGLLITPFILQ